MQWYTRGELRRSDTSSATNGPRLILLRGMADALLWCRRSRTARLEDIGALLSETNVDKNLWMRCLGSELGLRPVKTSAYAGKPFINKDLSLFCDTFSS